jgi:hypothetical protein
MVTPLEIPVPHPDVAPGHAREQHAGRRPCTMVAAVCTAVPARGLARQRAWPIQHALIGNTGGVQHKQEENANQFFNCCATVAIC